MRKWEERPRETAYLLNPAFCGRILYSTVQAYEKDCGREFPFPLIYLILPLITNTLFREKISSRTQLMVWLQKNPEVLIDYASRTKHLVTITNETIEFCLQTGFIELTDEGKLHAGQGGKSLSSNKYTDSEVEDCITKGSHVGRWFARAGKIENIYTMFGVRP
ncbi:MAG TPA: DUF6521 family protein [Lachnospiraceae bacterium]|nr:DUF6521 family protein [Lachnospiraceae bacterium]